MQHQWLPLPTLLRQLFFKGQQNGSQGKKVSTLCAAENLVGERGSLAPCSLGNKNTERGFLFCFWN